MQDRRDEPKVAETEALVPYYAPESQMQLVPYVEPIITLDSIIKPSPKGVFKQSYPEDFK